MKRSHEHFRHARAIFAGLLVLAFLFHTNPGTASGAGPDVGTDRLLIAEMEAMSGSAGKLSAAIGKGDFEAAGAQAGAISKAWPAVRDELSRHGDSAAIEGFESALAGLEDAIAQEDGDAAKAGAGNLGSALDDVRSGLGSVDADGTRVLQALVLPLLLVIAAAVAIPGVARTLGVRL